MRYRPFPVRSTLCSMRCCQSWSSSSPKGNRISRVVPVGCREIRKIRRHLPQIWIDAVERWPSQERPNIVDYQTPDRRPRESRHDIGQALGAVFGQRKMAKHFDIAITDDTFNFSRNQAAIAAEAALDGIYVVRTNLPAAQSDAAATVRAYKGLAVVERAFRSMKTVDLELRPVYHWTAPRVRAHVLLCMLAYYLEWHMRRSLAPMLFDEHDPIGRDAQRASPVAKAKPSPAARRKAATKQTDMAHGEPLPVHSFRTLLADLATMTRNTVRLGRDCMDVLLAAPTKVQRRAFDLLGVTLIA